MIRIQLRIYLFVIAIYRWIRWKPSNSCWRRESTSSARSSLSWRLHAMRDAFLYRLDFALGIWYSSYLVLNLLLLSPSSNIMFSDLFKFFPLVIWARIRAEVACGSPERVWKGAEFCSGRQEPSPPIRWDAASARSSNCDSHWEVWFVVFVIFFHQIYY